MESGGKGLVFRKVGADETDRIRLDVEVDVDVQGGRLVLGQL